jgi:hypothetical protein
MGPLLELLDEPPSSQAVTPNVQLNIKEKSSNKDKNLFFIIVPLYR